MATLKQRLHDPGYKAWIKAGLCLGFVKTGLEDFADQSSKIFHQGVLNQLRNSGNTSYNSVCNQATIRRGKVSCCNNCQCFVEEIDIQNQKCFKFQQGNWDNSDIQLWPKEPWEMAKVFMNPGQKATQRSPVDTDLSGILNFIDHCVVAKRGIVNTYNISKVRDARNKVMHSASMTISQTEFTDFTDAMVDLLEDPGTLVKSKDAQEATRNIRKVVASDFDISEEKELKVFADRTEVLQLKLRILRRNVQKNSESLQGLKTTAERDVLHLQEELKALIENEDEIYTEISVLKGHIETYEDIREEMQIHFKKLDNSLDEIRPLLLAVTQEIGAINERLRTLETQSSLHKETEEVLMERQRTLELRESSLEEQFQELSLSSFRETDIDQDARILQDSLIEEYKHIGFDVPLSPIYDGVIDEVLKVNINELYTDLVIVKPEKKEEIPLRSYKDIFKGKGRANRTIFLKGEAGVGKSTWCMQLLYAWVKAHDGNFEPKTYTSDYSDHTGQDLEETMSQFEYLFIVPLRYVKGKTSIKDVIFSSLLERLSNLKGTVRSIIENCSDKVLILLDGIDEYTENLSYDGLNQCTVVSTTRPWKYDQICATNPGLKIDVVLNLKGLDQSGIEILTKKVCMAMHNCDGSGMSSTQSNVSRDAFIQEQVATFIRQVRDIGMIDSLKNPLTLIIMLESYIENGSLSRSVTINMVSLLEVLVERGEQKMSQSELESSLLRDCKSMHSDEKSMFFAENESLSDYAVLLQKLSKLAFCGITSSRKENALVFNEKQLGQFFTAGELRVCFKFGLLSKSRYFTSMLGKMKASVSFYHKLVQEFFAAAWIVSNLEAVDKLKMGIASVSDILDYENIFVFICGLDAHIGSELTKHFVDICNKDSTILYFRNYCIFRVAYSTEVLNLSTLILRGVMEVNLSAKPNEPLYASDICVYPFNMPENTLLKILEPSIHCLRSLYLDGACFAVSYNNLPKLLRVIKDATELQELHVDDCLHLIKNEKPHDKNLHEIQLDFSRHSKLSSVSLTGNLDSNACVSPCIPILAAAGSVPNISHLKLTGRRVLGACNILVDVIPCLGNLQSLIISHIDISNGDLIAKCEELNCLCLRKVNMNESGFLLRTGCKLEDVLIDGLSMSETGWTVMFEQLSKQSNLNSLELNDMGNRREDLNLSMCGKLQRLVISNLDTLALMVCDGTDLSELVFEKVKMSQSAWCKLFSSLSFKNLKTIRLVQLDIGGAELNLSPAIQLEDVSVADVKIRSEDTVKQGGSEGALNAATKNTGWETFFDFLPTKWLRHLSLYNLDIGTAMIHVDQDSCLVRICLGDVEMSRKAFDTLHSRLITLPQLLFLDIERVTVEGDIRNMTLEDVQKEDTHI